MQDVDEKMQGVIITGAAGLIGSQLVEHFRSAGRTVISVDSCSRDDVQLDLKCDFRYPQHIAKMCELYGHIPVLINCFGVNDHVRPGEVRGTLLDVDLNSFSDILDVNVVALFDVCRRYARARLGRGARIVNFGASTGVVSPRTDIYDGSHKHIGYSTSKAAVIHMTKILGTHLVTLDSDMIVNCITPGGIEHDQSLEFKARYAAHAPAARMGRVDDLIPAVEMLIDERNRYMIGENIIVDGGWCAQ